MKYKRPPATRIYRQILFQRDHIARGLCRICNDPAVPLVGQPGKLSVLCQFHKDYHREAERKRTGAWRRIKSSSSYKDALKVVHFDPGNGQRTPCGKGMKFSRNWAEVTCEECFLDTRKKNDHKSKKA